MCDVIFSNLQIWGSTDVAEVGLLSRKTANAVSPVCVLTRDNDGVYTLTMTTTFRTVKMSFKLGEEFIEERPDGAKVEFSQEFRKSSI